MEEQFDMKTKFIGVSIRHLFTYKQILLKISFFLSHFFSTVGYLAIQNLIYIITMM